MQRKPVVIMLGPLSPPTGGMETLMRELLSAGLGNNYHLIHIDNSKPASIHRASLMHGGYSASLMRNPLLTLYSIGLSTLCLSRYLKQLGSRTVDLVHIHTASFSSFWEKAIYIIIARLLQVPVVLHIHGARFDQFYQASSAPVRRVITRIISLCNQLIVLSGYWRDFFGSFVPENRIQIVENGINISRFTNPGIVKTETPTLLFLGELSRRKGIEDLLQIVRYVKANGVTAHFIAAGPGNLAMWNSRIRELNLQDYLEFSAPVFEREKYQLLAESWIFILPSSAEGSPLAIIEALSAGLPVIATRIGGIPDMIAEGVNGFLTLPGDIAGMGKSIITLLQNDALRQKISANNIQLAAARFDIHLTINRLDEIYNKVIYSERMNQNNPA